MISPTLVPVAKQISSTQVCFPPSPSPSLSRHGWIGSGGTQAALCELERRDAFPSSSSFSLYSDPFILHWGLHSALQGELGEEGFLAGNCLPRSRDMLSVQREATLGWTQGEARTGLGAP